MGEELLAVLAAPTVINQFAAVLVTKSDVAVQKSDGSASGAGRLHIAYTVGTRNQKPDIHANDMECALT